MDITFSTNKLFRMANDKSFAIRKLGNLRAKLFSDRLIFRPHEEPIPTDKDGKHVWIEITGVEFLEITNYHGK